MSQPSATAAEPDFGPSLPQLLRRWLPRLARWQQVLLVLAAGAIVAFVITAVYKTEAAKRTYVQTGSDAGKRGLEPLPFRFDYPGTLRITKPPGAYVQAERTVNGTLAARMRVSPIEIQPQPGLISGYLPIAVVGLEREAARTYKNYRLQFEGRSRVNIAEGYQFAFNAQLPQKNGSPRSLYGRTVIIPEPYDPEDPAKPYPPGQAPKRGVLIQLLATTLDTPALAQDIGDTGILKKPFRTFRFG
jgi:hypothetical protein